MMHADPTSISAAFGQSALPTIDARILTNGGTTAAIRLDDQTYTLRITRLGKLILTK